MIHELKTDPESFEEIRIGACHTEIRNGDRSFRAGDVLRLLEYDREDHTFLGRVQDVQVRRLIDLAETPPHWNTGGGGQRIYIMEIEKLP